MKLPMSKHRAVSLLALIALFALSGCQTTKPGVTPTAQDPTMTPAPPTPSPVPTQVLDMEFGPGPFSLAEPTVGLDKLTSYKATLTLSFNGTEAGNASQWTKTYTMLVASEPAARMLTLNKAGKETSTLVMAEMDGAAYERRGDAPCAASVPDPDHSLASQMEPASFLWGVIGAEEAGSQTVNAVNASHYTFDESAFGQTADTKSTGEMWVAAEGGYLVKYLLTTNGGAEIMGEGSEGTLTWDYELTGVNQLVTIALPEDCPGGMVDIPLPKDASGVVSFPGALSFETATSIEDTADFYQKQAGALGWTQNGEPLTSKTSVMLEFTRASATLLVVITEENGVTMVRVIQERKPG